MQVKDELFKVSEAIGAGRAVRDVVEAWISMGRTAVVVLRDTLEGEGGEAGVARREWWWAARNCAALLKRVDDYAGAKEMVCSAVEAPNVPDMATAALLEILAGVYQAQDKLDEAEATYKWALDIRQAKLGPDALDVAATLNNLAGVYKAQDKLDEAEATYMRALDITQAKLGPDALDVATTLNNLAGVYQAQDKLDEAEATYMRALDIWQAKLVPDALYVAGTLNNLAGVYKAQDKLDEAEATYMRALDIRQAKLGPDTLDVEGTLNNLAGVYKAQDKLDEAEATYMRALDITQAKLGPDALDVATTLNNLAGVYEAQDKLDEAEATYMRALDITQAKLGPDALYVATTLNNLAGVYEAQDKLDEAEATYMRALDIRQAKLGPDALYVAATLNNLAGVYKAQDKLDEAEATYMRALDIRQAKLGPDALYVAGTLNNLAGVYQAQDKLDEAEATYMRALDIRQAKLGPDALDVSTTLNNLAGDKLDEAEATYMRALDIRQAKLGPDALDVATTLNNLAGVYQAQDKLDEAEATYMRALDIRQAKLGPDALYVAGTLNNLAGVYKAQDKLDEAEATYMRALDITQAKLGPDALYVAGTLNNLAGVYKAQDKLDEAEATYMRALDITQAKLGPDALYVAATLNNLAGVYKAQDKLDEAEATYMRALDIHMSLSRGSFSTSFFLARLLHLALPSCNSNLHTTRGYALTFLDININLLATHGRDLATFDAIAFAQTCALIATHFACDPDVMAKLCEAISVLSSVDALLPSAIHMLNAMLPATDDDAEIHASLAACHRRLTPPNWIHALAHAAAAADDRLFQTLLDDYVDTYWMVDDDLLAQFHHAVATYHTHIIGTLVSDHNTWNSPSLAVSEFARNRILNTFVRLNSIHDQMFSRCIAAATDGHTSEAYFPADKGSRLALAESLRLAVHIPTLRASDFDGAGWACDLLAELVDSTESVKAGPQSMTSMGDVTSWLSTTSPDTDPSCAGRLFGTLKKLARTVLPRDEIPVDVCVVDALIDDGYLAVALGRHFTATRKARLVDRDGFGARLATAVDAALDNRAGDIAPSTVLAPAFLAELESLDWVKSDNNQFKLKVPASVISDAALDFLPPHVAAVAAEWIRLHATTRAARPTYSASSNNGVSGRQMLELLRARADAIEDPCDGSGVFLAARAPGAPSPYDAATFGDQGAAYLDKITAPTFDSAAPDAFRALVDAMDFSHYRKPDGSSTDSAEWETAWAGSTIWIANDAKHVRLTPTSKSSRLTRKVGALIMAGASVEIDMVARRSVYFWTFAVLLRDDGFVGNAVELSGQIYGALLSSGHIDKRRIVEPAAVQYRKHVANINPEAAAASAQQYRASLETMLQSRAAAAVPHVNVLTDFLLRKVLQESHVRLDPDAREDALDLLRRAFGGTTTLLTTFGWAQADIGGADSVTRKAELRAAAEAAARHDLRLVLPVASDIQPELQSGSMREWLAWACKAWRSGAEGKGLVRASLGQLDSAPTWLRAWVADKARQMYWDGNEMDALHESVAGKLAAAHPPGDLDRDIHSQLMYAAMLLARTKQCQAMLVATNISPELRERLEAEAQTRSVELLIKVRSIAEHSLLRAFEPHILKPNYENVIGSEKDTHDIKYSPVSSEASWNRWLVASRLRFAGDTPADAVTIDDNSLANVYRELLNHMRRLMPLELAGGNPADEWLFFAALVSNQAKHENVVGIVKAVGDDLMLQATPREIGRLSFVLNGSAATKEASAAMFNQMQEDGLISRKGEPMVDSVPPALTGSPEGQMLEAVLARRAHRPPAHGPAFGRPLVALLRAAVAGADALARTCFAVHRDYFTLPRPVAGMPALSDEWTLHPKQLSPYMAEYKFELSGGKDVTQLRAAARRLRKTRPRFSEVELRVVDGTFARLLVQSTTFGLLQDLYDELESCIDAAGASS
ncbi:TPR repeat protein [Thecamonas trahens ATCC 50062]|uniref:TPR repeat protein n=1 Tax=Thecamonas trahens ATCC 50062 TaxID=461836 RepID=A0A0L0DKZ2_THETB|nr:TPR repeat protein [Thecamonas trahens ATCC 50062]KNC53024.1 TPR repeat protein [Thecamonas trahens ATCC 50062]|eukprot:XP_013754910.1 TPR repeat protein [Thecamonas trahens ATCC 50062]